MGLSIKTNSRDFSQRRKLIIVNRLKNSLENALKMNISSITIMNRIIRKKMVSQIAIYNLMIFESLLFKSIIGLVLE